MSQESIRFHRETQGIWKSLSFKKKRPELAKLLYPTHGFKFGPYNPVFTGLRYRSGV